jgi:hypothetical protein
VHHVNLEDILVSFHRSFDSSARYDIQFSFTRTPLKIQHRAVTELNQNVWLKINTSKCLDKVPSFGTLLKICGKVKLNHEQLEAVKNGINNPSYPLVIHGPPGTNRLSFYT